MTMSSSPPLVSVIVPVYEVENYLVQCLDSILAQTLKEIEVICVNDGSPDACPKMLDEYARKDKRIRVIHQENRGLSGARNTGIRHARAQYIGFVDSDDWIEPQTYELALAKMREHGSPDVVYWGFNEVVERDGIHQISERSPFTDEKATTMGVQALSGSLKFCLHCVVWNKLYKAELIHGHDITFPEGQIHEDVSFWWKYAAWVRYGCGLPTHLYNYRVARAGSIMALVMKNRLSVNRTVMRLFEEIYAYYARFDLVQSHDAMLTGLLVSLLRDGVQRSTDYDAFIREARRFVASYPNLPDIRARTLWYLRNGKPFVRFYPLSPLEKIFSVTNAGSKKIFRVLGLEFAVDRSLFGRKRECS
jgi:glycosyltransferase involved in cell wall biosynthesis